MAPHLIELQTTDYIIIADQIVALISALFLLIILCWVIASFKKDKALYKPMSLSCILSILCFTLFAFIGAIGWTNVIFPISSLSCKIIYPLGLINYNIAKIAMYWLLTLRIEVIFEHSALEFNTRLLSIYRLFAAIIPSVLWSIWIYLSFIDLEPHTLHRYSHCFPMTFRNVTLASHIAGALAWSDLTFSAIAVYIFIYKLYQVTSMANSNLDNPLKSDKFRHSLLQPTKVTQKWVNTIRKSTMLCIIAILSTWTYVLGTAYILRQCGFFISFDGVINAICLAFLFNFGNKYYNALCKGTVEKCCIDVLCCCYCCTGHGNTRNNKRKHPRISHKSMGGVSRSHKYFDVLPSSHSQDLNDFSFESTYKETVIDIAMDSPQMTVPFTADLMTSSHSLPMDETDSPIMDGQKTFVCKEPKKQSISQSKTMSKKHRKSSSSPDTKNTNNTKSKKASFSNLLSDSGSTKSVTFMLLDMSDDENEEGTTNVYSDVYNEEDQSQVLIECDEEQITDEDFDD